MSAINQLIQKVTKPQCSSSIVLKQLSVEKREIYQKISSYQLFPSLMMLLLRNFCQKSVRVNFCNFNTVPWAKFVCIFQLFVYKKYGMAAEGKIAFVTEAWVNKRCTHFTNRSVEIWKKNSFIFTWNQIWPFLGSQKPSWLISRKN